tara:strand:- start:720 stop:971 length:252 start_codon:yes stop_codon:yes gene_type:complete
MTKEFYRVVASAQTRDPYPVYKYFEDPEEWIGSGTVVVSCKEGKVDVKIMEKDSIKIHHIHVHTDDGPVKTVITEQFEHPEKP